MRCVNKGEEIFDTVRKARPRSSQEPALWVVEDGVGGMAVASEWVVVIRLL